MDLVLRQRRTMKVCETGVSFAWLWGKYNLVLLRERMKKGKPFRNGNNTIL